MPGSDGAAPVPSPLWGGVGVGVICDAHFSEIRLQSILLHVRHRQ